jgi:argininosuccinate synthase
MANHNLRKIVLAFSGGLDTSVSARWLTEKYDAEVITVTVDVGQQEDLTQIAKRSKAIGVKSHYSIDARDEFATDYLSPAIKANAMYEGVYPLSTALSRPLICSKLVEVARKENASAVAHGCTGKGNDQVRFEVTAKSLAPEIRVLAPVRDWNMSRDEEIKYAKDKGIKVSEKKSIYSVDQNMWGRSIECGPLEDPNVEPPEEVYEWTTSPEKSPQKPEYISLEFIEGELVGLDSETLKAREIIERLNLIAGRHGVGRIDHVENRLVGIKSREVYECPAAVCILAAHKDLEKLVLTRHEARFKKTVEDQWAILIYEGLWVEPLKQDLDVFIESTQKRVTGTVRLKLYKGIAAPIARASPYSLYDFGMATYDASSTFDQSLAKGFIELWGLPTTTASKLILKDNEEEK